MATFVPSTAQRFCCWWLSAGLLAACWLPLPSIQAQAARRGIPQSGNSPDHPASASAASDGTVSTSASDQQMQTLAIVNGQVISRQQVANESLKRFGEEVLESMISKQLVLIECQRRGLVITEKDVNDEITQKAKALGMSGEKWMELICKERKISVDRVKNDIVWMQMALRRLAEKDIQVSPEEIQERLEYEYGPKVRVREIVLGKREEAETIRAAVVAQPEEFGNFAKQYSQNPNSQALKGLLPPIARHSSSPEFEAVIFAMQPGQISDVLQFTENQFVLLKCEEIYPPSQIPQEQLPAIQERIIDQVSEAKLTDAAAALFKQLQDSVQVVNVLNDPDLSQKMPGVAALVDQLEIRTLDLAEECIVRFGPDILEAEINRTLLLQALKQVNLQVAPEEVNAEVHRAADSFGYRKPDGTLDIQAWLTFVTDGNLKKVDFYVADEVWPTVAMKKLVERQVQVSEDDLQKGFEANYGPRVECLAILLDDQRRALKVWQMASANPTREYFGQLAKQYSCEPASQNNYGEVPPIQRHGGRPELEKEAFALKPNEISKVVQVGEYYIILYCLGQTQPTVTEFEAVKDYLYRDILEKKLRIAMRQEYESIRQNAQIDNFLAGTSQPGKALRAAAKDLEQKSR